MYFVMSVLYEITCITSNTEKPHTDSNPGIWILIYMTNTVSTNIWRQKKFDSPTKFPWRSSGAGFLLYNRGDLSTGRICYTMHPPARNSRSQTGTPGASRTHNAREQVFASPRPCAQVRRACWWRGLLSRVWVRRGGGHSSPCSSPSC